MPLVLPTSLLRGLASLWNRMSGRASTASIGWTLVNPNMTLTDIAGRRIDLHGVYADTAGWVRAVGDHGVIIASPDFGITWVRVASGTDRNLRGVSFAGNTGLVVGERATVLRTTDGGSTWIPVALPLFGGLQFDLNNVRFASATRAVAVGITRPGNGFSGGFGVILLSTDGGSSWSKRNSPWNTRALYDVDFAPDTLTGIAVGGNTTWPSSDFTVDYPFWGDVLRTVDGGYNWTRAQFDFTSPSLQPLAGVAMPEGPDVTALGAFDTLIQSADAGQVWSSLGRLVPVETHYYTNYHSVSFADRFIGMAVGTWGSIVKTGDGGQNWTLQSTGTDVPLFRVCCVDANRAAAVGPGMTALTTSDGGTTWSGPRSPSVSDLFAVKFVDATTGTAVGARSTILRTTDGGITWTPQNKFRKFDLYGVDFSDALHGVAVGLVGEIWYTADGGATWQWRHVLGAAVGSGPRLNAVAFFRPDVVVGVGNDGAVVRSLDGGASEWHSVSYLPFSFHMNAICAAGSGGIGYVVGANSEGTTIFKTTVFGSTWFALPSPTTQPLLGVHFNDELVGTVVGTNGAIYRTTNGGVDWTSQPSGTTLPLRSVHFVDQNIGVAVGGVGVDNFVGEERSVVLRTANGGASWSAQPTGMAANLHAVALIDGNTGVIVGRNGIILRTTTGGT